MAGSLRSYNIADLTWVEVREHLPRDSRLIVPVGACDQHGSHLPIGTSTVIAESFARDLSEEFGVLRAPAFPYGVNFPTTESCPGAGGLHEKTLLRALNDLLAAWEKQGFTEFILISTQQYDPHVEAIAAVLITTARVRVVEALAIDLSTYLDHPEGSEHGGEAETSLMLYLRPDAVIMDAVRPSTNSPSRRGGIAARLSRPTRDCPAPAEHATLATAEKGRRIYAHILEKIRDKVFGAPAPTATAVPQPVAQADG